MSHVSPNSGSNVTEYSVRTIDTATCSGGHEMRVEVEDGRVYAVAGPGQGFVNCDFCRVCGETLGEAVSEAERFKICEDPSPAAEDRWPR